MNIGREAPAGSARPAWVVWAAYVAGALLLAGAIAMAARQSGAGSHGTIGQLWSSGLLRDRWWMAAGLVVLPLLNFACSTALLMVMTLPHVAPGRRLRFSEMAALVGGAWLLNYLPMAPGLIGRAAYHARVHGIPLTTTARIIAQTIGVSAGALAISALGAGLLAWLGAGVEHVVLVVLAGVMLLATVPFGLLARAGQHANRRGRIPAAVLVRICDIAVWAARYGLAFGLLGVSLSPAECVAFAVVSQVAVLVPLLGNGLGLREWAVGMGARLVPSTADAGRGLVSPVGLSADLINRAAEVLVAIPVGLVALIWLARSRRRGEGSDQAASDG